MTWCYCREARIAPNTRVPANVPSVEGESRGTDVALMVLIAISMNDFAKPRVHHISARPQPISRKLTVLALGLFCFVSGIASAASVTVPVLDRLGAEQGTVKYN